QSDWQLNGRDRANDHHQNGNNHRDDRTVDEEFGHASYLAAAGWTNGLGLTWAPGPTFCTPSATTRSPGFKPSCIIHTVPTRSPGLTFRMTTLLSLSTTATW